MIPRGAQEYAKAASGFEVAVERRILHLPYHGTTTSVPVHLLSAAPGCPQAPVLLFSGGVALSSM